MPERKLSILWENERGVVTREVRDAGKKVIIDLQIDRVFRTVCPDTVIREAFLNVLLTPCTEISEIRNRTRVLNDFRRVPQMLDQLIELVRRIVMTKNTWDSERSRLYSTRRVNPQDKSSVLWAAREGLVLNAHFIRTVNVHVHTICETLNMFGCVDGWLGEVREAAFALSQSSQAKEINAFAERIEKGLPNAHTYDVEFRFDAEMRTDPYFLRDFRYINSYERPQKKQKTSLFSSLFERADKEKKPVQTEAVPEIPEPPKPTARVEGVDSDWSFETAAKAVQETDRYLTGFLRAVIEKFSALETELYFYKAALQYVQRFDERNVKYAYPEFREASENRIDIRNLSDVLLLTESMSVLSVVPNDVYFRSGNGETSGILVTGKNNSGKTVYLRSVGTAVLLAQCGLPVPCESAVISIRNRIFTSFAAAEGELLPLSSAGRFEEEVAAISQIIDAVEPSSLLLMNETFQTTAYDEGAEGMYHILNYIAAIGCGFIFVTHLLKLKELYEDNRSVEILKTSDSPQTRYKIGKLEG
ncbi:MAG: hypothetical protein IKU40_11415 [Clostridia bacterium]|nr:hypothetical protein [Clostridia bacterium]